MADADAKGTLVADVVAADTAAGEAPCIMGTFQRENGISTRTGSVANRCTNMMSEWTQRGMERKVSIEGDISKRQTKSGGKRDCSKEDIRAGKVSYEPTHQELQEQGNKGMASHKLCI